MSNKEKLIEFIRALTNEECQLIVYSLERCQADIRIDTEKEQP